MVQHFSKDYPIKVFDLRPRPREVRALGAVTATLEEAARQDVVVPCVPIAEFEGVLQRLRGLVRGGALVLDVCSVKEHPVRAMKAWLPRSVDILATHPNFGPDSAADSLRGRSVVVWPVRIKPSRYAKVRRALQNRGLEVVEMSPREHDRRMASSLVLTHFIGRGLLAFGAAPTGIDTEGYQRLLRILQTVQNDTWQLFRDMNLYNAFAGSMRRRWLAALRRVDRKLARTR